MKTLLFWYLASVVVLWLCHRMPRWYASEVSKGFSGSGWTDRFARRLATRKHEPTFCRDALLAGIPFLLIYASVFLNISPTPEHPREDFVIAGLFCIGFCLLVILGLGANIAINAVWSRSYPLIAIYFATLIVTFSRIYVLFGVVDNGKTTHDFRSAVYLSLITIANLGSGDVVPSADARFVAVTESLIGYVALAFFAALVFTTMQRGMRRQIRAYNRRRKEILGTDPANTAQVANLEERKVDVRAIDSSLKEKDEKLRD